MCRSWPNCATKRKSLGGFCPSTQYWEGKVEKVDKERKLLLDISGKLEYDALPIEDDQTNADKLLFYDLQILSSHGSIILANVDSRSSSE